MRFGVNTFIWSDHFDRSYLSLLDKVKQAGFDGIELPLFEPDKTRDPELKRALESRGLYCTFCSIIPAGLSPISDDASVRKKTREHLLECIKSAAEMGSTLIAGPLYSPVGYLPGRRRTEDEWKRAIACYQELGPVLDQYKVTLAIEPLNRYETYFLNTASDAAALCREVGHSRIGVLFDTYHANIEEKHVASAIIEVGPHLRHFHACENDRGIPGSGHIEWSAVFDSFRKLHYDGWLTIESFGFALGALSAAASIWRDLAPTPEAIAFEGLRFLKQMEQNRARQQAEKWSSSECLSP
jgi:D-psicose/D-tagatose/L-ribulose 3-epimerase